MKKFLRIIFSVITSLVLISCSAPSFGTVERNITLASNDGYEAVNDYCGDTYICGAQEFYSPFYYYNVISYSFMNFENDLPLRYATSRNMYDDNIYPYAMLSITPYKGITNTYANIGGHQPYRIALTRDDAFVLYNLNDNLVVKRESEIPSDKMYSCCFYIERKLDNYSKPYYRIFNVMKNSDMSYSKVYISNMDYGLKGIKYIDRNAYDDNLAQFVFRNPCGYTHTIASNMYQCTTSNSRNDFSLANKKLIRRVANDAVKNESNYGSKLFTYGITCNNVRAETDSYFKKHFYVNYSASYLTLNAGFTYANSANTTKGPMFKWSKDTNLGCKENGRYWYLDTVDDFTESGQSTGGFIVQKEENGSWVDVERIKYVNNMLNVKISENWKTLLSTEETKFRIAFVYGVRDQITKKHKKSDYRLIYLISDEFYLSYEGFASDNFLPVIVSPLIYPSTNQQPSIDSYKVSTSYSENSTVLPNSLVYGGFSINCLHDGYYAKVYRYISLDDYLTNSYKDYYSKVTSETNFSNGGLYRIITYNSNEEGTSGLIEVIPEETTISKHLFNDKPFSNELDGSAFVNGARIYSGALPDELKEYGLDYKYQNYQYPTYSGHVMLKANNLYPTTSNFELEIEYQDYNENKKKSTYSASVLKDGKDLYDPGLYKVTLDATYNSKSGMNGSFVFYFYIVEPPLSYSMNVSLVNASQEYYDLKPNVYTVYKDLVEAGYYDGALLNEKSVPLVYAFASYQDALSYAISKCKKYAVPLEDGTYSICENGVNRIVDEVDAFNHIYNLAKTLVGQRSITSGDINSITGFNLEGAIVGSYSSIADVPSCYLVTSNSEQLSKLTSRQLCNNFEFINDSYNLISKRVELRRGDEVIDSNFPYFTKIEDYMLENNLPSGDYAFYEYTPVGVETIHRSYITPHSDTHNYLNAVTTIQLGENIRTINMTNYSGRYVAMDGFTIKSVVNPYDDYCLVRVTLPNGDIDYFASCEVDNVSYSEIGDYLIYVEDRVGNRYEITVKVG